MRMFALSVLLVLASFRGHAYDTSTGVGYIATTNQFSGISETEREWDDWDQYNCGYWVNDDFGSYCYMWLLSLNDPYVDAYTISPSSSNAYRGSDVDTEHAVVNYGFSVSQYGRWTGEGWHFVQQKGFVQYCPYGFCGPWIPFDVYYYNLGITEAWHSPIDMDITRYDSPNPQQTTYLTTTEVDSTILPAASAVYQINHGGNDVACPITFRRTNSISTFNVGNGLIDSGPAQYAVQALPERVHLVREFTWCNGPPESGTTIIGCSSGGGMVVRRWTSSLEGILWAHEFGHNQDRWLYPPGNGHLQDQSMLGYKQISSNTVRVSQGDCDIISQALIDN